MERLIKKFGLNRVAEIKLTYRSKVKPSERPQIIRSTECAEVLRESWDTSKIEFVEQFKVMCSSTWQTRCWASTSYLQGAFSFFEKE